jgi:hypothetical protein
MNDLAHETSLRCGYSLINDAFLLAQYGRFFKKLSQEPGRKARHPESLLPRTGASSRIKNGHWALDVRQQEKDEDKAKTKQRQSKDKDRNN